MKLKPASPGLRGRRAHTPGAPSDIPPLPPQREPPDIIRPPQSPPQPEIIEPPPPRDPPPAPERLRPARP